MATTTAKVRKKKNPVMVLAIIILIVLLAVVSIQIFWPQTLDSETGKLSRLGGAKKKPLASSSKTLGTKNQQSQENNIQAVSDADNPLTTQVVE